MVRIYVCIEGSKSERKKSKTEKGRKGGREEKERE